MELAIRRRTRDALVFGIHRIRLRPIIDETRWGTSGGTSIHGLGTCPEDDVLPGGPAVVDQHSADVAQAAGGRVLVSAADGDLAGLDPRR